MPVVHLGYRLRWMTDPNHAVLALAVRKNKITMGTDGVTEAQSSECIPPLSVP